MTSRTAAVTDAVGRQEASPGRAGAAGSPRGRRPPPCAALAGPGLAARRRGGPGAVPAADKGGDTSRGGSPGPRAAPQAALTGRQRRGRADSAVGGRGAGAGGGSQGPPAPSPCAPAQCGAGGSLWESLRCVCPPLISAGWDQSTRQNGRVIGTNIAGFLKCVCGRAAVTAGGPAGHPRCTAPAVRVSVHTCAGRHQARPLPRIGVRETSGSRPRKAGALRGCSPPRTGQPRVPQQHVTGQEASRSQCLAANASSALGEPRQR